MPLEVIQKQIRKITQCLKQFYDRLHQLVIYITYVADYHVESEFLVKRLRWLTTLL
jgi:hypothetical protein